ncbi:MAG: hypothetical protein EOP20_06810 [Hyphomicrobiales bacterium]|nr:MAG: hypothetical protein EOP20_06810 [Hyphomicrobiales bacterium]
MSDPENRHEEPALERAVIYRGPQAPVLQAYVPLPVFGLECMLLLVGMRLVGFWTLLLLPLHMVLVLKTNDNPFWVRDLLASYRHRWFAQNKNTHGIGVVSFSPHVSRRGCRGRRGAK